MIIDRSKTAGLGRLQDPRFNEFKKEQEVYEWGMRQYIAAYPNSTTAERYREILKREVNQ